MDEIIKETVLEEQNAVAAEENQTLGETETETTGNEVAEATETEPKIDYVAELEKEKKLRDKAEKKIVELKREKKSERTEDDEVIDDDPYGIKDIVASELNKFKQSVASEMLGDVMNEELGSLAASAEEKELILYHYENTIKPSGYSRANIHEDLAKAKLLANSRRIQSERDELARAGASKSSVSTATGSNQDKLKPEPTSRLNAAELAILKRRGIDPTKIKID